MFEERLRIPVSTGARMELSIAVVHNHDESRLSNVRRTAALISSTLKELGVPVNSVREFADQPTPRKQRFARGVRRSIRDTFLMWRWAAYLMRPESVHSLCVQSIAAAKREWSYWRQHQEPPSHHAIEPLVTAKHVAAWRWAVSSGADWMLLLEDDVQWDAIRSQPALAELVATHLTEGCSYVDLAGGFPLEALGVEALLESKGAGWAIFLRPVTNCAAAYLVSKPLLSLFISIVDTRPGLLDIGIDFLLNELFMESRHLSIRCSHAHPPALVHGSAAGMFNSWDDRQRNGAVDSK